MTRGTQAPRNAVERRRSLAPRDQAASAFSTILLRLVDGTDAVSAMLVDVAGETVDYAGSGQPFDLKVAAAEWRLVLCALEACSIAPWRRTTEIYFRARDRSFAVFALSDGYALVLELQPRAFDVSSRALAEVSRELEEEGGLRLECVPRDEERWARIEVRTDPRDHRRPEGVWVEGGWVDVDVLGHYRLGRREVGYRARLASGAEITLIREPLGRWYADVLPGG